MRVEGDHVEVAFADGRRHRVRLEIQGDTLFLSAIVVGAAKATNTNVDEADLWRWNRGSRLSSFRFDSKGRIVGEALMPLVGLTQEAVRFRVRIVAEECDHFERALTGGDVE